MDTTQHNSCIKSGLMIKYKPTWNRRHTKCTFIYLFWRAILLQSITMTAFRFSRAMCWNPSSSNPQTLRRIKAIERHSFFKLGYWGLCLTHTSFLLVLRLYTSLISCLLNTKITLNSWLSFQIKVCVCVLKMKTIHSIDASSKLCESFESLLDNEIKRKTQMTRISKPISLHTNDASFLKVHELWTFSKLYNLE